MVNWGTIEWGVVGLIVLTLLLSGVTVGDGGFASRNPTVVGDGTASATVESLPTERLHVDDGRFGTDVRYLRVPDATVRVSNVTGTPRLVYRVQIPGLDVDESVTRLLREGQRGRVELRGVDVAFDPPTVTADHYDGTVSVRVQSFEVDETVLRVNETVEVEP